MCEMVRQLGRHSRWFEAAVAAWLLVFGWSVITGRWPMVIVLVFVAAGAACLAIFVIALRDHERDRETEAEVEAAFARGADTIKAVLDAAALRCSDCGGAHGMDDPCPAWLPADDGTVVRFSGVGPLPPNFRRVSQNHPAIRHRKVR